MVNQYQFFADC